jgi:hypothetical protein
MGDRGGDTTVAMTMTTTVAMRGQAGEVKVSGLTHHDPMPRESKAPPKVLGANCTDAGRRMLVIFPDRVGL